MNAVGVEKNDVRIEIIKKRRSDSVVEHTGKNIKTHNNNNPGVFLSSPLDPADSSRSRHLIVSLSLVFGLSLSNVLLSKGSKSPSFSPSSSLISITFTQPIFPDVLYPFTILDYPHSG